MRVLVCGANGFLGAAISERLAAEGHAVLRGVRTPRKPDEIAIDFVQDTAIDVWQARLHGLDAVVNAVGILVERGQETFSAVHRDTPCALFAACAAMGVRRVIQISALGADAGQTGYFTSKRAADAFLMDLPLDWQIMRPALVYGPTGASARFFRTAASLPVLLLPAGGQQALQPVHIDDLADAVCRLLDPATPARQIVPLVGREPVTYREMLTTYRRALGMSAAPKIGIASHCMTAAARVAGRWPGSLLTPDTWRMLQSGNTGDARVITTLLGRPPRSLSDFISPPDAAAVRWEALAGWWLPLLRLTLALVWLGTAIVSAGLHPVGDSLALLARVGLHGTAAQGALYGAILLDLVFGVATLLRPGKALWVTQFLTILAYSIIIAVALPEFLWHPFGPIIKNLPILALLVVFYSAEVRR